jgi:hypothetical protein
VPTAWLPTLSSWFPSLFWLSPLRSLSSDCSSASASLRASYTLSVITASRGNVSRKFKVRQMKNKRCTSGMLLLLTVPVLVGSPTKTVCQQLGCRLCSLPSSWPLSSFLAPSIVGNAIAADSIAPSKALSPTGLAVRPSRQHKVSVSKQAQAGCCNFLPSLPEVFY